MVISGEGKGSRAGLLCCWAICTFLDNLACCANLDFPSAFHSFLFVNDNETDLTDVPYNDYNDSYVSILMRLILNWNLKPVQISLYVFKYPNLQAKFNDLTELISSLQFDNTLLIICADRKYGKFMICPYLVSKDVALFFINYAMIIDKVEVLGCM
jgi:hypothetical protein